MNFQKMTKKQLEEYGRTIGIELDRRKTKKDMIAKLKQIPKKKKTFNDIPPAPTMAPPLPKKGFWQFFKNIFKK